MYLTVNVQNTLNGRAGFIEKSKLEIRLAKEKGLERLPSINGPYLLNPANGKVVGRKGSLAYLMALYGDKSKCEKMK